VSFMGDIYAAAQHTLICLSTVEARGGWTTWLKQFAGDYSTQHDVKSTQKEIDGLLDLSGPRPSDEDLRAGYDSFRKNHPRMSLVETSVGTTRAYAIS
jgi:hypothetical protein